MKALAMIVFLAGCGVAGGEADRVADARKAAEPAVRRAFKAAGLDYPPARLYLRGFKQERELEVWAADAKGKFALVSTYPIAAMSGGIGPKRREGDLQVPEGFYRVDRFNPRSRFLLSLGLDYPNQSDRKLGGPKPGGDIFIHGGKASIGCLAMTDPAIQEIYVLTADAKAAGGRTIPVHLFPARLTDDAWAALAEKHADRPDWLSLWRALKKGYDGFERTRQVPSVRVKSDGTYDVSP